MEASYPYDIKWIKMQLEKYEMKMAVKERAIVVLSKRDCCMCFVIMQLLRKLGVNPHHIQFDEKDETRVINDLKKLILSGEAKTSVAPVETFEFPVVFIGGQFFGGLEKVMASHIAGELIPTLKKAGALWL